MAFQKDNEKDFWADMLYYFYPQLNKDYAQKLNFTERKKYIERVLRETYRDQEGIINNKIYDNSKHWEKHKKQVEAAMSEAFELDCKSLFNGLRCSPYHFSHGRDLHQGRQYSCLSFL